jgi:hypothetical protein
MDNSRETASELDRDELCGSAGFGNFFTMLPHTFEVKFDGLTYQISHLSDGLSGYT